jgi:hypothetical protein
MQAPTLKSLVPCLVLALAAGAGFAQNAAPAAPAPEIKLDTGLVYARGTYGLPTNTDIFMALVSPTYETPDWRLQASFPYIWLRGPASVVGNAGTVATSRSEHGIGDATLAATRKFAAADGWFPSFGAKIKLPTADDAKGLGTGRTDLSLEGDVAKKFGDITPYATLGYQFLGRSAQYPMKDGLFGTLGFVTNLTDQTVFGLAGNWRQPTISGGASAQELMAFVQQKITGDSHLQFFVLHGFTDASPTLAVGATLGLVF